MQGCADIEVYIPITSIEILTSMKPHFKHTNELHFSFHDNLISFISTLYAN
jgi:hypothetical protein